jgi:D-arabinose 1-dehydrogenase-like Zn-dependent alcohol dehydrogenase
MLFDGLMTRTMRAERFYAETKTIVVEDVPIPEPGPGEVLVKIAFCGICHSVGHHRQARP